MVHMTGAGTQRSMPLGRRAAEDYVVFVGHRLHPGAGEQRVRFSQPTVVTSMQPIISVAHLSKTYASGFQALKNVDLDVRRGETPALLSPNGAGKTTLIGIICGILKFSGGSVSVVGHDIIK